MTSPFKALQSAVDIVHTSSHVTNRIAATIFHLEQNWSFSNVNFYPPVIEDNFGVETKIGNASGTIHAETACLFHAAFEQGKSCQGAHIAITDPPCPNCVKNMAEAGIDNIYIDHKGFHKDFAARRIDHFNSMSIRLAEKAGISMYEVNRKEQSIKPITIANEDYIPKQDFPIVLITDPAHFKSISDFKNQPKTALACIGSGENLKQLICKSHPALGFKHDHDEHEITHPETKYSYIQESCNRLLMNAARLGMSIDENTFCVNELPTSREFINIIGAGIKKIKILNAVKARDEHSLHAKQQILQHKIIQIME